MMHLPPGGFPLTDRQIFGALTGWFRPAEARAGLEKELQGVLGVQRARLIGSGRAALFLLLRACREAREGRDEVLIGAYTCWSVAAAVVRAGLRLRLADVDPDTLDFHPRSLERLEGGRVLALVTHHLFGMPNDTGRLASLARSWGAFLIDDAAQGFGAFLHGEPLGSFGDAGLLSFGRGKGLPALRGGAMIFPMESPLAEAAVQEDGGRGTASFARAAAHRIFFGRHRYAVPARMPQLRLGETVYDPAFRVGGLDGFSSSMARQLLRESKERIAGQREAAGDYAERLGSLGGCRTVRPNEKADAVYLRFPLLVPPDRRPALLGRLAKLGVTASYPEPVHRIGELAADALVEPGPLPGSEEIARSLLTLPTHPLARPADRERIARVIEEACR